MIPAIKCCFAAILTLLFSTASFDPDTGLVAYYDFNECDARDVTGHGSDGQLYGGVGCWCGIEDDGLLLDGIDDFIEFKGIVNRYFSTSDFSISFYFKSAVYRPFGQSLLSKRLDCTENFMFDLHLDQSKNFLHTDVHENDWKDYRDISPDLPGGDWVHFALVRQGTRAYTFINGQPQKEARRCSGVDITNDALLSFANSPCLSDGFIRRFKGIVDELRVYDRALTPEEMLALYSLHPVEKAETDCVL